MKRLRIKKKDKCVYVYTYDTRGEEERHQRLSEISEIYCEMTQKYMSDPDSVMNGDGFQSTRTRKKRNIDKDADLFLDEPRLRLNKKKL